MYIKQVNKSDNSYIPQYIGPDYPVFLMLDIGSTHCGSVEIAKQMIDLAKEAGIDCIKMQKRDIDTLLTEHGKNEPYNSEHSMADTYGEHRKKMELTEAQFIELQNYTISKKMFFSASAWDIKSLEFLNTLDLPFIKIASADLTNIPLLHEIAKQNKPVIFSTGMATENYILNAFHILKKKEPLGILQCTSSYPTPLQDVNLNVIKRLQTIFPNDVIGFSDHTLGHHISLGAVAIGANIIEKHFTLDNNFKGSDHMCALNPENLKLFVHQCRDIDTAIGSKNKIIQKSEKSCITKLCKSVVATCNIPKGTIITKDMITTKSPATGIPAYFYNSIIGKEAKNNIIGDTALQWKNVYDQIEVM